MCTEMDSIVSFLLSDNAAKMDCFWKTSDSVNQVDGFVLRNDDIKISIQLVISALKFVKRTKCMVLPLSSLSFLLRKLPSVDLDSVGGKLASQLFCCCLELGQIPATTRKLGVSMMVKKGLSVDPAILFKASKLTTLLMDWVQEIRNLPNFLSREIQFLCSLIDRCLQSDADAVSVLTCVIEASVAVTSRACLTMWQELWAFIETLNSTLQSKKMVRITSRAWILISSQLIFTFNI